MNPIPQLLWLILAISFVLVPSPSLHAKTHWLKEAQFQSAEARDGELWIKSQGTLVLQLRVIHDDVIRVWMDPLGTFKKNPSLAVLNEDHASKPIHWIEEADQLRLITAQMEVRVHKNPLRLDFYDAQSGAWITGENPAGGLGWDDENQAVFLNQFLGRGEHFYGLGEDNDTFLGNLDRRGTRRDMWTGQEIRKGHVTADIPVNFFMSTGNAGGGYGMFFDNSTRTLFDMGASHPESWSWNARQGEALFYLIKGPDFPKILDRYTQLTGRPSLPPLWALGFIQSKCCYWNWQEIDEVSENLKQKKIPFDVLVIDYNWSKVPMDFQWAERWGTQVAEKLSRYQEQGRRFLLSTAGPMIRKDASNYQDGLAHGVFASDGKGHTVSCGHYGGDLLDFTAPGIKDWLWPQIRPLYEQGIDGWWLDLTEPEGEPEQTIYHDGPSALIHNNYALLNSKVYYEMQSENQPMDRPFILTRTGSAGIQRYGTAIWTGDTWSDYATFMAHVPEALNTTMSGIPYWTNDSGGFLEGLYKNNLDDHGRLYERWLEFSVFSPITRVHHVGPSAPYMFGPEVEETARHYLNQRYRLLPYIYSYSWQAHQTGSPLLRPLIFAFQQDPEVFNIKDEYLFGESMLVAPVLTEGSTLRKVYLPEGRWIDQDYGHEYAGQKHYCVAAPRQRIPVFIRSGAIIPKAPLMQHTAEKPWDPITLELYPDGQSSFTLYQDDGLTQAFAQHGAYTETRINMQSRANQNVDIAIKATNSLFLPNRYTLEVHLTSRPRAVTWNGQSLKRWKGPWRAADQAPTWSWDEALQTLTFEVISGGRLEQAIHIDLDGSVLARPLPPLALDACPDVTLPTPEGPSGQKQIANFFPPPKLPTEVQAENYDKGGESIAYHDRTPGNQGGLYRQDDVDLAEAQDAGGGTALSSVEDGEWVEYTLTVPKTGFYDFHLRYSATHSHSRFHLEQEGMWSSDVQDLPATGTIQDWRDAPLPNIYLQAGEQVLRLSFDRGGMLVNSFRFTAASAPQGPKDLCQAHQGGFGQTFSCFSRYSCKKINDDWEHNSDPAFWCLIDEL